MLEIIEFNNYLSMYIGFIALAVSWILWQSLTVFKSKRFVLLGSKFNHAMLLEAVWTILPALILITIAVPSFNALYSNVVEDKFDFDIAIKVVGHQWYWSYEYTNMTKLMGEQSYPNTAWNTLIEKVTNFDSFMTLDSDLIVGSYRLLEVDQFLMLPRDSFIKFLITSSDVLHAWAVPSLGIKTDACPGRLSTVAVSTYLPGQLYGQCSEICGINHGFMPILVKIGVYFDSWISSKFDEVCDSIKQLLFFSYMISEKFGGDLPIKQELNVSMEENVGNNVETCFVALKTK
jgi:heme/copper-type cytochrome/quinol oxidase subunit 2